MLSFSQSAFSHTSCRFPLQEKLNVTAKSISIRLTALKDALYNFYFQFAEPIKHLTTYIEAYGTRLDNESCMCQIRDCCYWRSSQNVTRCAFMHYPSDMENLNAIGRRFNFDKHIGERLLMVWYYLLSSVSQDSYKCCFEWQYIVVRNWFDLKDKINFI